MQRRTRGGVAKPPVFGSRVLLDGKAVTVGRVYGDLVGVVYENEASVVMVPMAKFNQTSLDTIGRNVRAVVRRHSIAEVRASYRELRSRNVPQVHCLRRPQARGTARRRIAVRRTCGATRDGPSRSTDDELEPDLVAASLAGGAA